MNNLIGSDIVLMRKRYDEALKLQGIPCQYQYPNFGGTNEQGEPLIDSYSEYIITNIFLDNKPTVKTYRRYGWVVENDESLPFLLHCSFNLPHLQVGCLFRFSGQYSELPDRIFRVTELTYALQAADHIICQVVPVYGQTQKQPVGRTQKEIEIQYNKSNYFLKPTTDYRGEYHKAKEDVE